jgi:hypothetical protein
MMRIGLVGLPNVGKSSLFNLLTEAGARVDSFPFTTTEKNTGVVLVPDERLRQIQQLLKIGTLPFSPRKPVVSLFSTPAHVEFVDIAGLVKGASQGEGLGNKFLAHVRESSLLLHIMRAFDSGVVHPYGGVEPVRDREIVESELALADLEVVDRRLETLIKEAKTPEHQVLLSALRKTKEALGVRAPDLLLEEQQALRSFGLFALKPVLYLLNCSEDEPTDIGRWPGMAGRDVFLFSAQLEREIKDFADDEKRELRRSLNLAEAGPWGVVERCFERLGLVRFYTVKGVESRAWAIPAGTPVIDAARTIHTDMADGFIRAEVLAYADLLEAGDFAQAREQGKLRVEGKHYVVKDGDVILIKFRT